MKEKLTAKTDSTKSGSSSLFAQAFSYSVPVFLGYLAIGAAFGLLLSDAGYPLWMAFFMSVIMYAGAGQYIAVGLFAAGTTLLEACLIQFVVNARHIAYGLSMINRFPKRGFLRVYLIFSMTDETFALLSSLPPDGRRGIPPPGKDRDRFMFYVALLDHGYWISGSVIGAAAGALVPFSMDGIAFALTALFVVLLIEQIFRLMETPASLKESGGVNLSPVLAPEKLYVFLVSAAAALLAVFLLPERIALLAGMALALLISSPAEFFSGRKDARHTDNQQARPKAPPRERVPGIKPLNTNKPGRV